MLPIATTSYKMCVEAALETRKGIDGKEKLVLKGTCDFHGFPMSTFHDPLFNEWSCLIYYKSKEEFPILCKLITAHSSGLYVKPPRIELILNSFDILNDPLLKNGKKWNVVRVNNCSDTLRNLSSEEAEFLLNDSAYTEELHLRTSVQDGYHYSDGFKFSKVHVTYASCIQLDAVVNSDSQEVKLWGFTTPSAPQLVNLLKLWRSKQKMVNLTSLRLNWSESAERNVYDSEWLREFCLGSGLRYQDDWVSGQEVRRVDGQRAVISIFSQEFSLNVV